MSRPAELIQVIRTTLETRGDGKSDRDPTRRITQFWSTDGLLLAEVDPEIGGSGQLPSEVSRHLYDFGTAGRVMLAKTSLGVAIVYRGRVIDYLPAPELEHMLRSEPRDRP